MTLVAPVQTLRYSGAMPDDLYDHGILAWSEHQSSLLRRVARGEQVNEVDWPHVVEEIEDVGLSELNVARSILRQMLVHLLKIHGWPNHSACRHSRGEHVAFQTELEDRFASSMRQRIDQANLYQRSLVQVEPLAYDDMLPRPWPHDCPFTLDDLLTAERSDLEACLTAASA
jgi:hypothetical protein